MTDSMPVRREIIVSSENGLHIVPCSVIAKLARDFQGKIRFVRDDRVAEATSVFDLLGLNAQKGTLLILEANGEQAEAIADQIVAMFEAGFDIQR